MQGASKHLDAFVFDSLQLACLPFPPPLFSHPQQQQPLLSIDAQWSQMKDITSHDSVALFSAMLFLCVLQGEAWLLCLLWGAGCIRARSAMQLFECIRFLLMPIQAICLFQRLVGKSFFPTFHRWLLSLYLWIFMLCADDVVCISGWFLPPSLQ